MHRSKCAGRHSDRKKGQWRDTAGRLWVEYECDECGRHVREVGA